MAMACSTHGRRGMRTAFWWGKRKERDNYEDLDEDNIKICVREIGWEYGLVSFGPRYIPVACSCEQDNGPSDSTECWEIFSS
jgi:hypothetical protein